ncbi:PREDICTED: basement membrane proteoglycan-like [Acropora digitifera]|uniref:basement membrane proteoglycan-like n=1 Tax=Acropora digitifera TaxID=70779 RepID=UPI00077AF6A8|nr:PREDICTED: basement membrane proteoglycan-like [Acropora digitifera]
MEEASDTSRRVNKICSGSQRSNEKNRGGSRSCRPKNVRNPRALNHDKLSVFVMDARVIVQKILPVQQPERPAVTVESEGILLEFTKPLRNESLIPRTLHTNGMQMDFAYMCSSQDPLRAQTTCFFFTSVTNLLIHTVMAGVEKGAFENFVDFLLFLVSVPPRISLNPGPRYAIQGSTFTLPTCHVTGYPTPVVTWRKLSGHLPLGRVRYNNSALQISQVRKEDSGVYTCSAKNLPGKAQKQTMFVVVSLPRFTTKPPSKIVSMLSSTVRLNCSATGDPQPIISWRKQGGQLPVGRSQQINGTLVITNLQQSDAGSYICTATSASVFDVEAVTALEIQKAGLSSSSILGSLDVKYIDKLNSFLAPVLQSSSRSRFVKCWHAKTDGWAASTFHSNCDGKGPTVTIIQVGSYIFGGYTDVSWSGSCDFASSSKSFIYSLYNINGFSPVKLQIISGQQSLAILRCSIYGPTFGGTRDILISNNAASNRKSQTYCGHTYSLPPGYSSSGSSCRFYAGKYKFTPTNVEVFYETTT